MQANTTAAAHGSTNASTGSLIGIAAVLFLIGLVIHPTERGSPEPTLELQRDQFVLWITSQWVLSAAIGLFATAGMLLATQNPRRYAGVLGALICVASLVLLPTQLLQATAQPLAAQAGDAERFEAINELANAFIIGLPMLLLCLALLLLHERRVQPIPRWALSVGAALLTVGSIPPIAVHLFRVHEVAPLFFVALLGVATVAWWGFRAGRTPREAPAERRPTGA